MSPLSPGLARPLHTSRRKLRHPGPHITRRFAARYAKDIREREEKLMLAVLESAVENFQKYVVARNPSEKSCFKKRRSGF